MANSVMKQGEKLAEFDRKKYVRQLSIHGLGETGQQNLKNASALVARGGGVGGTVAIYLAAAGIGRMTVMHGGNLTWSNLNRQILMNEARVGQPRADQIRDSILRLNPAVDLTVLAEDPNDQNLDELVARADVVCDCVPTWGERYALNRAIVRRRKPMVEAAMNGMEAYLTVFQPGETPCLHCLYPAPDPDWNGLDFPVLGAVSGAVACLAAIEAIKVVAGFGQPLRNQLLFFDTEYHEYRKFNVHRDPSCPVCGHL
jgi:molybdopterin/thiamine biosynthesis adenylyltransferase